MAYRQNTRSNQNLHTISMDQLRDIAGHGGNSSEEFKSPLQRSAILAEISSMMIADPQRFVPHIDMADNGLLFHEAFFNKSSTIRNVGQLARNAELIVWSRELWDASQSGAEAFHGKPMAWDWGDGRTQVWMWDKSLVFTEPEYLSWLNLNTPCALTAVMVGRAQSMYFVWGIFSPGFTPGMVLPASPDAVIDACAKRLRFIGCMKEGELLDEYLSPLAAAYAFMTSTFATTEPVKWSRQVRRNAERHDRELPREPRIVVLRKRTNASGGNSRNLFEWNHQWVVSGHWRNQWYPKSQAHKPAFIAPHLKGPEGKPLLQPRDTIFSVRR